MDTRTIFRSFGLGGTCGLRSMTGPAVTRWRAGDRLRLAYAAFAVGELIADKLPGTPARTIPPALLFRIFSGGVCGASLAASSDDRPAGAIFGALGAVAGTFAGFALRTALVKNAGLPDLLVALAEDALAVGGSIALTRP